jgi:CheY-like chemotaxis protein
LLTGRKLLLADDSLTIQKVVSLTFGDEDMQVTTAGGGAEALERLSESLPDIVLADVFMPEPNGYALCERIKMDARTRHIPVVLLVGTFEPFNEAEARRVGANEVLTKPFQSIRDLVNKVGGLLGGQPEEKTNAAAHTHDEGEATRDLSPFAADARAAEPSAPVETARASDTADAFADFDMDDATIQTTPVAAFDARPQDTPDFSEIREEEQFSDRGETEEAFVLSDLDDEAAPDRHAVAPPTATSASTESIAAAPHAGSTFEAHASRAAEADDALLELGDITPARAATDEADDFILDIGDEDSFDSPVAAFTYDAAAEADMLFAEQAQTTEVPAVFTRPEAPAETDVFSGSQSSTEAWTPEPPAATAYADDEFAPAFQTEPAHTLRADAPEELDMSEALGMPGELDRPEASDAPRAFEAPEILDAPALLFANEPPAPDAHEPDTVQALEEHNRAEDARAWDGDPAAASAVAHAGGVAATAAHFAAPDESRAAQPFAAEANLAGVVDESSGTTFAPGASASGVSGASSEPGRQASTTAASLSPEVLDELVRRVVAQMSEQVVREIAWEVVPDMAERLIKRRLEEEERTRTP